MEAAPHMFRIVRKHTFTEHMFLLEIEMPNIASKARPGHYVDIHMNPDSAVVTLPIVDADADAGTFTVIDIARDLPSEQLMMLQKDDEVFQVRGPLGTAIAGDSPARVLLVGEDLGIASLLWRARLYREAGAYTICVVGFADRESVFWEEEFAAVSDELYVVTEDGSYGVSGKITGPVRAICETHKDVERMVMIGRLKNMKRAAKIASDNEVAARMSFDAIRQPTGAASIFDVPDSAQEAFGFARAPELDANDIDFDKLIARERAAHDAQPPAQ